MTEIIAEIGSNWSSLEDCLNSISQAKLCGADVVKFQAFTYKALYGIEPKPMTTDGGLTEVPYDPHSLSLEWLPKLKEKADAVGIEFMCTAFSPELVKAVDPYVKRHKIASSDLTGVEILGAIKATGKPVILSTGSSSKADIQQAVEVLKGCDVTLLYCVSAYPANSVNLRSIEVLREAFSIQVGYSDHSTQYMYMPWAAVHVHGATIIEKHVNFVANNGPDSPHSCTGDEFKKMVEHIRESKQPIIAPLPEEEDMLLRHNRRLIATKSIMVGERFKLGFNFGSYRSRRDDTEGMSPFKWYKFNGLRSKKNFDPGDPVTIDSI